MKHVVYPKLVLALGLALGIAVDLLFHGHALGISMPLFVLLLLAALFYLGSRRGVAPAWRNLWLLAPLVFFSAMVAVRANQFLTFLNVVASLALLGLVAHYYAAGRLERLGLLGYPVVWLRTGLNALYHTGLLLRDSPGGQAHRPTAARRLLPVLRGLLLALPVLVIFTCLLSWADLVFARYVREALNLRFWREFLGRASVVLVSGWFLAGSLAYALRRGATGEGQGLLDQLLDSLARALSRGERPEGDDGLDRLLTALGRTLSLGVVEVGVVLGGVNLLFGSFVGIQFAYLFGGETNIRAQGFTYAEYARRGFFELVFVALLALALALGLNWLTRRETARERWIFGAMGSLLAGLVLVMLASAFYRLRLYEQAYGFTEMRLYVYVFMGWLAVAIAWFVVVLWRLPGRFAVGALVTALGFVVTLNLINPDAFIVKRNLAHYRATGKLDTSYLMTLSEDATPQLVGAVDGLGSEEQQALVQNLQHRWRRLQDRPRRQGWQSFHLARWRAYGLLQTAGLDAPQ